MLNRLYKFCSWKNFTPAFGLLIFAYFFMGFISLTSSPITGDELAHLSGAHGISQGRLINVEHPPFLKMLNGIVLNLFFNKYDSNDDGQWSRSVDFLIYGGYAPYDIIQASRAVYLIFNSLLLIWLMLLSQKNWLSPKFGLILGILYTFSPSMIGQNFLLLFDISAGITALMTIISLGLLANHEKNLSDKSFYLNLSLIISVFTIALNVKFSNFILFPIILGVGLLGIFLGSKYFNKRTVDRVKNSLFLLTGSFLIFTSIIFSFAYRNTPSPLPYTKNFVSNFWIPIYFYGKGLSFTLDRSQSVYENYVDDRFEAIKYPQFANRVFWFKENPVLVVLLAFLSVAIILKIILALHSRKLKYSLLDVENYIVTNKKYIFTAIFFLAFPLTYIASSWNTTFTIGYRHYYPVLIFIYAGIAAILSLVVSEIKYTKFKNLVLKSFVVLVLLSYASFGLVGLSQGVRYVNGYWNKEKWRFATDSTVSWGEGEGYAVNYLVDNNLLTIEQKEDKKSAVGWNTTFDSNSGPNIHIHLYKVLGKDQKITDVSKLFTDLSQTEISKLKQTYLVVDFTTFQRLSAKSKSNTVAKINFEFLINRPPIWDKDKAIFIYKIN